MPPPRKIYSRRNKRRSKTLSVDMSVFPNNIIHALDYRASCSAQETKYRTRTLQRLLDAPYTSTGMSLDLPIWCNDNTNSTESLARKRHVKIKTIDIKCNIESLTDLIQLLDEYPMYENVEYNINLKPIHNIKEDLVLLNSMIGMQTLKKNILDQILYYAQNMHCIGGTVNDYMHTVIYGPPGTGKTDVARLIGNIFSKLGVLSKGTFKKVTRSDLVAGFLGQTAIKTSEVIKDAEGGVLFIDEAYALGNSEKRDSFAKECIDTLCEALSEKKGDLMVIVAGYPDELKSCFFDYNAGLESRFVWRFETSKYNSDELRSIFIKIVKDGGWQVDDTLCNTEWFEKNYKLFTSYGRDMQDLVTKTKIAHSRRVFCNPSGAKKQLLTLNDIEKGLDLYKLNREQNVAEEKTYPFMYV